MPKIYLLLSGNGALVEHYTGTANALIGVSTLLMTHNVTKLDNYPYTLVTGSGLLIMTITEDDIVMGEDAGEDAPEYFGETPHTHYDVLNEQPVVEEDADNGQYDNFGGYCSCEDYPCCGH